MNKTSILQPTSPRITNEFEEYHSSTINPDEWFEVVDKLVKDEIIESIQKLRIEKSKLVGTVISGLNLDKCEISDTILEKIEAVAFRTYRASYHRTIFTDTRATGADFAEGYFEDCVFRNVKFDEVGFRMAHFKRARFENCVLNKADFYEAQLTHVSFNNCELEQTNFDKAICKSVDFRGENIAFIKGVLGLKGAIISEEQLIMIAPLLAAEMGFKVSE